MNITELLNIESLTIRGCEYEVDLESATTVDSSNLDYEFARHTKLMLVYSFAYEQALAHVNELEIAVDKVYAMTDTKVRSEASSKLSEKMVESAVETDPDYIAMQDQLLVAKKHLGLAKACKESMQHRKDCLISLGALERALMQSEPSLRRTAV